MNRSNTFAVLWRTFADTAGMSPLVLFGFKLRSWSIGINAVIPLISLPAGRRATDFITRAIQGLFAFLHIPFSFRYLLGFILGLFILRAASVVFSVPRLDRRRLLGQRKRKCFAALCKASWPFLLKQKIGDHNTWCGTSVPLRFLASSGSSVLQRLLYVLAGSAEHIARHDALYAWRRSIGVCGTAAFAPHEAKIGGRPPAWKTICSVFKRAYHRHEVRKGRGANKRPWRITTLIRYCARSPSSCRWCAR